MGCLGTRGLTGIFCKDTLEEVSGAGCLFEKHSSLGCVGGTQAWQLPVSWDLTEQLYSSVLGVRGTSSIPDIPILLLTWHRGLWTPWEVEAARSLSRLLCSCGCGEGEKGHYLTLGLPALGCMGAFGVSRRQGKGREKLRPRCVIKPCPCLSTLQLKACTLLKKSWHIVSLAVGRK